MEHGSIRIESEAVEQLSLIGLTAESQPTISAFDVLRAIKCTSGKNDKRTILKDNSENTELKDILRFAFDSLVPTGLSIKKIHKKISVEPDHQFLTVKEMMDYLTVNNTGTDQVVANVQAFINSQPEKNRAMLIQIACKSLKIGCDEKSCNKVYGKTFIPKHEVQQAYPFDDKHKLKDGEWFSLSHKLNGIRGSYVNGNIKSRQGKEINGMDHIIKAIKAVGLQDYFVDGELIRRNVEKLKDSENFLATGSIVNSDFHEKSHTIDLVIFDFFPQSEFESEKSLKSYKERSEALVQLKDLLTEDMPLRVVDIFYQGTDQSMIPYYLDMIDEQKKEGLMLNKDMPYQCKRHSGILKVKTFKHCDVLCTGIEKGKEGRFENTLGSIIVDYKGFSVGVSGFTDEQRELYYSNPDLIVGKIVQVKYKEESKNRDGGISLQFPTFCCLRDDKAEPSYN